MKVREQVYDNTFILYAWLHSVVLFFAGHSYYSKWLYDKYLMQK